MGGEHGGVTCPSAGSSVVGGVAGAGDGEDWRRVLFPGASTTPCEIFYDNHANFEQRFTMNVCNSNVYCCFAMVMSMLGIRR